MYGIKKDGGIIVYEDHVPGSKEMIQGTPECPEGYKYSYEWVEDGNYLVQQFTYTPLTEEEKQEAESRSDDDISYDEALAILLGGAV